MVLAFCAPFLYKSLAYHEVCQVTYWCTNGFGPNPNYKVTISSDGSIQYVGGAWAPRRGTWTASACEDLTKISQLLHRVGFWKYSDYYAVDEYEMPRYFVSAVAKDGSSHGVMSYGKGPQGLLEIQDEIDKIWKSAQNWKPSPD